MPITLLLTHNRDYMAKGFLVISRTLPQRAEGVNKNGKGSMGIFYFLDSFYLLKDTVMLIYISFHPKHSG